MTKADSSTACGYPSRGNPIPGVLGGRDLGCGLLLVDVAAVALLPLGLRHALLAHGHLLLPHCIIVTLLS